MIERRRRARGTTSVRASTDGTRACHGAGMDEGPSASAGTPAERGSARPDRPETRCRRGSRAPSAGLRRPSWACWPGSWLLTRLHDLLLTFVVALFLSFALEPAVDSLARRGWRRGPATALVLVVLLGTLLIFFGLIGKLVVDQVTQFIDQAPAKSQNLEHWINRNFGTHLSNKQISKEFNDPNGPIRGFATHLAGNALGFSLSALGRDLPLLHHPAVHLLPGGRRAPLPAPDLLVPAPRPPAGGAGQLGGRHPEDRRLPLLPPAARDHPGRVPLHRLRHHRHPVPAGPGPVRGRGVAVRPGGRAPTSPTASPP